MKTMVGLPLPRAVGVASDGRHSHLLKRSTTMARRRHLTSTQLFHDIHSCSYRLRQRVKMTKMTWITAMAIARLQRTCLSCSPVTAPASTTRRASCSNSSDLSSVTRSLSSTRCVRSSSQTPRRSLAHRRSPIFQHQRTMLAPRDTTARSMLVTGGDSCTTGVQRARHSASRWRVTWGSFSCRTEHLSHFTLPPCQVATRRAVRRRYLIARLSIPCGSTLSAPTQPKRRYATSTATDVSKDTTCAMLTICPVGVFQHSIVVRAWSAACVSLSFSRIHSSTSTTEQLTGCFRTLIRESCISTTPHACSRVPVRTLRHLHGVVGRRRIRRKMLTCRRYVRRRLDFQTNVHVR
mmetsp:Transcript_4735/g.11673  ORF Transcript_4735/g.11673 Transcript_4735/m.11673 type:complete len:350 (-) Transcript_4735:1176-2225(-)